MRNSSAFACGHSLHGKPLAPEGSLEPSSLVPGGSLGTAWAGEPGPFIPTENGVPADTQVEEGGSPG